MAKLFIPDFYVDELLEVDWSYLAKQGIRQVYLDIDNTLELHGSREAGERTRLVSQDIQEAGLGVSVLSNAATARAANFCRNLGLDYVGQASKPLPFSLRKHMEKLGLKASQVAIVGDQIFTDLWCARALGATAILAKSLAGKEGWGLRLKRQLELLLLKLGQDPRRAPRLPSQSKDLGRFLTGS
ncbi:MAG: YqeG family HAD IIIA-type phosphatase [Eubacteriales bacterium]|nr:YqeG family HAD IIIA-type phosphatase [Eubacteriales bacterium]